MGLKRYATPALALFLLSPVVGELLSGSSPPLEFFNPLSLIFLLGLYGSGAVIIRELAFRWHKGWPSILVMGAAYGIVEEGLMCKSFFNPNWPDVGLLGSYGRLAGVNCVWAVEMMVFHAVFSITIPILLVSLAYPGKRDEPWARDRTLAVLGVVMSIVVVLGYFKLVPYAVPSALILLSIAAVLALLAISCRIPHPLFKPAGIKARKARWFFIAGLICGAAIFLINWIVPWTGLNPLITISLDVLSVVLYAYAVFRMSGAGYAWGERQKLALAAGTLGFLMILGVLEEAFGALGMSLVSEGFALGLVLLYRAVAQRERNILKTSEDASQAQNGQANPRFPSS